MGKTLDKEAPSEPNNENKTEGQYFAYLVKADNKQKKYGLDLLDHFPP